MSKTGIRSRLLALSGVLSVFLTLVGGGGLYALRASSLNFERVVFDSIPKVTDLETIRSNVKDVLLRTVKLCMPGLTAKDSEKILSDLVSLKEILERSKTSYYSHTLTPDEKQRADSLFRSWKELAAAQEKVVSQISSTDSEARTRAVQAINGEFRKSSEAFLGQIDEAVESHNFQVSEDVLDAQARRKSFAWFSGSLILLGAVASLLISYFFAGALARQLHAVAIRMHSSAVTLNQAASSIAGSSARLSDGASEQSSRLELTSQSVHEVGAMVSRNAHSAEESESLANSCHRVASDGKRAVTEMVGAIGEIEETNSAIARQIDQSNSEIGEIVKVISEIGEKTRVINDIVFQTRLLSFNASVEAARAGEHGKGFAVVAEEVGNLAQMSGKAAREISGLLEGSVTRVESIVEGTRTSVARLITTGKEKVATGGRIASQCSEVLDRIVSDIDQLKGMAREIAAASTEQSQGMERVRVATDQLASLNRDNRTMATETATTSEVLREQSADLSKAVQELELAVRGGAAQAPVAGARAPGEVIPLRPRARPDRIAG